MLALRGLLRVRNVIVIALPAGALFLAAHIDLGDHALRTGVAALVVAPAPLFAPEVLLRAGRRGDLAGSLALGTVAVTVVLLTARAIVPAEVTTVGLEAFVLSALASNAIPRLRDAVLVPLRVIGWISLAGVAVTTLAAGPHFDGGVLVGAVLVFVVGLTTAVVAALLTDRDRLAAVAGSGLRDPAIACAIAYLGAGPDAAAVPLAYGVFCLGLGALALRRG